MSVAGFVDLDAELKSHLNVAVALVCGRGEDIVEEESELHYLCRGSLVGV